MVQFTYVAYHSSTPVPGEFVLVPEWFTVIDVGMFGTAATYLLIFTTQRERIQA